MRRLLPLLPILALLALAPAAQAVYPGANGRVIYVAAPAPGAPTAIFTANPDGSDPRQVTPTLTGNQNIAFQPSASADGKLVVYAGPNGGIWMVGADGSNNHMIVPAPGPDQPDGTWGGPQLSPDGRLVTFTFDTGMGSEIWIANADGSQARMFYPTDLYVGNQQSRFSPDGRTIAFLNGIGGGGEGICTGIYGRAVAGGRPKLLFGGSGRIKGVSKGTACRYDPQQGDFDWAPNGKALTFSGAVSGRKDNVKSAVLTARLGAKKPSRPLTPASGNSYIPIISPDGTSIAWTGGKASNSTLLVPVRGGRSTPLGPYSISDWAPQAS
jgi:Tol biopolymer transport system component